jgi:dienelactone hydrolase
MQYLQMEAYLDNMDRAAERQYAYTSAEKMGGWGTWQRSFRKELRTLLGMHRIHAQGIPLQPRLEETKACTGYTQYKYFVTSEPGVEIPFYLLVPDGEGPFPLVITPHGHTTRGKEVYTGNFATEEERQGALDGDRDLAVQAVTAGYAAIAPDVRGFWEMARESDMKQEKRNSCLELQRSSMMYGRTLIGERVHDMSRLIDFAETRPEIDSSRIVMTGNSGGGTVTLFAAALDERISIAIPGSYLCTFKDSIVSLSHCSCNLIPGVLQLGEMYDIAGLIAPRPFLAVHGAQDPIYPIRGTQEAFDHVMRIYEAMGHADRCELYIGEGGHRYYKERVWDFVKEHLAERI